MTGQPLAATAIELVREAMRIPPVGLHAPTPTTLEEETDELAQHLQQSAQWEARLRSAVGHLDADARLALIGLLANLGSCLAVEDDPHRRRLLLDMLAGAAEAD